jgi:hypothetical protein
VNEAVVIVLREQAVRERVEAIAIEHGWRPVGDVVRGHFVLASRRWYDAVGTMIEYLEDHTADVRYFVIEGAGQDEVAALLRERLPCFTETELLAELDRNADPVAWVRGLGRLAVLRPKRADARFLAVWERALQHPARAARRAAIRTAYGCSWPELAALVRARLDRETELHGPLEHLHGYLDRAQS